MKIISHRKMVTVEHYEIYFQYTGATTFHGFIFQALKSGEIDLEALKKSSASLDSYNKCINKEIAVDSPKFQKREHNYIEPAIGQCICGCEVILDRFTNTCGCGRDYNMSGQALAPREQWGEETGETYADIMNL